MTKTLLVRLLYTCFSAGLVPVLVLLTCTAQNLHAQPKVLFRDDFKRSTLGPDWTTDNTWTAHAGSAYNEFDMGTLLTTKEFTAESYILETAARGFGGSYWRQFRIIFGQTDPADQKAYVISYSPDTGGQLTLGRATDNIYHPEVLDEIGLYPALDEGKWYRFKVARYKSGLIQVYLNKGAGYGSLPILEAIDKTYLKLGHFGWMVSTQTAAQKFYVDWIEAREPENEKPGIPEIPVEDDLITQVSAPSGKPYKVAKLGEGSKVYADRDYQVTSVPSFMKGASFIQTSMEDKFQGAPSWLTTFMKKAAIVYVAYDPRAKALPGWLAGWHKTGDVIGTNDPGSRYLEVYSTTVDYWQVYPRPFMLGGNAASPAIGAKVNYMVIAVPRPETQTLEAESAVISGAVKATDHVGYSGSGFVDFINQNDDYIEWTAQIKVPGTYTLGFKFANGGKIDRALKLTVDDSEENIATFLPISGWDSWAFYSGPSVYLTEGTHTFRATATGNSGPNIDFLSINFSFDYPEIAQPGVLARLASPFPSDVSASYASPMAYPNPFELSTTILYMQLQKAPVNLTIYSMNGQKQAVLVNSEQPSGQHIVEFTASKLPGGEYLYRLTQGDQVTVGKLLKR